MSGIVSKRGRECYVPTYRLPLGEVDVHDGAWSGVIRAFVLHVSFLTNGSSFVNFGMAELGFCLVIEHSIASLGTC